MDASHVRCQLCRLEESSWTVLATQSSNNGGRVDPVVVPKAVSFEVYLAIEPRAAIFTLVRKFALVIKDVHLEGGARFERFWTHQADQHAVLVGVQLFDVFFELVRVGKIEGRYAERTVELSGRSRSWFNGARKTFNLSGGSTCLGRWSFFSSFVQMGMGANVMLNAIGMARKHPRTIVAFEPQRGRS